MRNLLISLAVFVGFMAALVVVPIVLVTGMVVILMVLSPIL